MLHCKYTIFLIISFPFCTFSDGSEVVEVKGMSYLPIFNKWCWNEDTSVNYALRAIKNETTFSNSPPKEQTTRTDNG